MDQGLYFGAGCLTIISAAVLVSSAVAVLIMVVVMRMADDYIPAETAIGIMLIAAGLGLLLYYFLAGKKADESLKNRESERLP